MKIATNSLVVYQGNSWTVLGHNTQSDLVLIYNPDVHKNAKQVHVSELADFPNYLDEIAATVVETPETIVTITKKPKEDIHDPDRFSIGDRVRSLYSFQGVVVGFEGRGYDKRIVCRSFNNECTDRRRYAYKATELRFLRS